jgi:hypothetical protein
MDDILF